MTDDQLTRSFSATEPTQEHKATDPQKLDLRVVRVRSGVRAGRGKFKKNSSFRKHR